MADYIRREDALFALRKAERGGSMTALTRLERAYAEIREMPAADVAEVVHGQWIFGKDLPYNWGKIPKNKYHLYCSECLEQAFNRSEDNDPDFDVDTSYCSNCGARMDGGKDDEAD